MNCQITQESLSYKINSNYLHVQMCKKTINWMKVTILCQSVRAYRHASIHVSIRRQTTKQSLFYKIDSKNLHVQIIKKNNKLNINDNIVTKYPCIYACIDTCFNEASNYTRITIS